MNRADRQRASLLIRGVVFVVVFTRPGLRIQFDDGAVTEIVLLSWWTFSLFRSWRACQNDTVRWNSSSWWIEASPPLREESYSCGWRDGGGGGEASAVGSRVADIERSSCFPSRKCPLNSLSFGNTFPFSLIFPKIFGSDRVWCLGMSSVLGV
jgi:hypothetical protein